MSSLFSNLYFIDDGDDDNNVVMNGMATYRRFSNVKCDKCVIENAMRNASKSICDMLVLISSNCVCQLAYSVLSLVTSTSED